MKSFPHEYAVTAVGLLPFGRNSEVVVARQLNRRPVLFANKRNP